MTILHPRFAVFIAACSAVCAASTSMAPSAQATTIVYEFSSVSFQYLDVSTGTTDTDTLSGTLTYDTVLTKTTAVDFTVSGPNTPTLSPDPFTNAAEATAFTNDDFGFEGTNDASDAGFAINFVNSLSNNADDPITVSDTSDNLAFTLGICSTNCTGYVDFATSVSGSVDPISSVPEPASLALLSAALVGFGAIRRRYRVSRSA